MPVSDIEHDVRQFHRKFRHPAPGRVRRPAGEWVDLRKKLIREEAEELVEAIDADDPAKIAREAVDLIYVAVGTLVAFGIRLWPMWRAVQRANMMKTPAPAGQKPGKPAGWVSPDEEIRRALEEVS